MSAEKLTLRERVEKIEAILDKLGLDASAINLEETIQETIKTELEEAKAELNEIKVKASTQMGNVPDILNEICQTLESELGLNLTLLRKHIKEL